MLLFTAIFAVILPAFHVSRVLGGAAVDGVIGGVPNRTIGDQVKYSPVHLTTPGKLRVKKENSGICETTPNVYQASGYGDLRTNESTWFWFFGSQNDAENAPVVLWLNSGPEASSMIGLFRGIGPCRISNDSQTVSLNPYSWNKNTNLLFIDQPVGFGFSYGTMTVNSSTAAAADMWTFLQMFFSDSRFCKYAKNNLGIWGESYSGHVIPKLSTLVLSQNAAIAAGQLTGVKLNLQVIGLGDPIVDPLIQYASLITYAAWSPYHYRLVPKSVIHAANKSWTQPNGCRDQITECYDTGANQVCSDALTFCNTTILVPLHGQWDMHDIRVPEPADYPPDFTHYIDTITKDIGAETLWQETNTQVYNNFAMTGDQIRNSTSDLKNVIDAGVRVCFYEGDADYIVNYKGVEDMLNSLKLKSYPDYEKQKLKPYTVQGQFAGLFKNVGKLSYLRVNLAGHEVPAYGSWTLAVGQAALQFFSQIMADQPLTPT